VARGLQRSPPNMRPRRLAVSAIFANANARRIGLCRRAFYVRLQPSWRRLRSSSAARSSCLHTSACLWLKPARAASRPMEGQRHPAPDRYGTNREYNPQVLHLVFCVPGERYLCIERRGTASLTARRLPRAVSFLQALCWISIADERPQPARKRRNQWT